MIGDKMLLVAKFATIESISLWIMWRLNFFNHHTSLDLGWPIDDGLISNIDLVTKFGLPGNKMYTLHVNIQFFLWGLWALCCLTPTIAIYLGREGWNLYECLNFRLSYCICNWCWILIVVLKVEFDLIVNELTHSQMDSHFGSWSPNGLPNL
jgi:hypothetical protein